MKKQKSSEEKALKDVNAYLKKFTQPLLPAWQFKQPLAPPYFPRHGNLMDKIEALYPGLIVDNLPYNEKIELENKEEGDDL